MLRDFAKDISIEQVSKAARAQVFSLWVFWTLILGIFVILTIYQTTILGIQLTNNEIATYLKVKTQVPMKFPAVTVCSLSPYKASAVANLTQWQILKSLQNHSSTSTDRKKRQLSDDELEMLNMTQSEKETHFQIENFNLNSNLSTYESTTRSLLTTAGDNCTNPDYNYFFKIRNVKTNLFYDFRPAPILGKDVYGVLSNESNSTNQQFYFVSSNEANKSSYYILNRKSRKFVIYTPSKPFWDLFELPCNLNNMSWQFPYYKNGTCKIVPTTHPEWPLEPSFCNSNHDNLVVVWNPWPCYDWSFEKTDIIPENFERIQKCNITVNTPYNCSMPDLSSFYKMYVAVSENPIEFANDTGVLLQTDDNDVPSQEWAFEVSDAKLQTYKIRNRESGLLLTWQTVSQAVNMSERLPYEKDVVNTCPPFGSECPMVTSWPVSLKEAFSPTSPLAGCQGIVLQPTTTIPTTIISTTSTVNDSTSIAVATTTGAPSEEPITTRFKYTSSTENTDYTTNCNPTTTIHEVSTVKTAATQPYKYDRETVTKILNLENNDDAVSRMSVIEDAMPLIMSSLNKVERSKLGFHMSEVISHCTFAGQNCDMKNDILQWNDMTVGNCFTFNHKNSQNIHYSSQAGRIYGLKYLFKIPTNEMLSTSKSSGVKIFIHEQHEDIFPDNDGYTCSGSFDADFAIKYHEVSRLFGDCTSNSTPRDYYYKGKYSQEGCIHTCFQKQVLKTCGCGDPRFKLNEGSFFQQSYCGIDKYKCLNLFYNKTFDEVVTNSQCTCLFPCHEELYTKTLTYARLQLPSHYSKEEIKQSILVQVYFDSFNYVVLEQVAAYSMLHFLSDLGGIFGNNLGFSFITVFELLILLLLIIVNILWNSSMKAV